MEEIIESPPPHQPPPPPPTMEDRTVVISYSNLRAYKDGMINCTIVHKVLGEIPFTYSPNDDSPVTLELRGLFETDGVTYEVLEESPLVALQVPMSERNWRDTELTAADEIINKIEDFQIEGDSRPWRQYRAELRNWPQSQDFPDSTMRPVRPAA